MDSDSQVVIHRWHCPYRCGWYRDYGSSSWMNRDVHHPLYGPVTEREAVRNDIDRHNCRETYNARLRLHRKGNNVEATAG